MLLLRTSVRNSHTSRVRVFQNVLTYQLSNVLCNLAAFSPLKVSPPLLIAPWLTSSFPPSCGAPSSLLSLSYLWTHPLHSLPLLLCDPLHPSLFQFLIIVLKKYVYLSLLQKRHTNVHLTIISTVSGDAHSMCPNSVLAIAPNTV